MCMADKFRWFRDLEITVRGADDDGADFCSALVRVDVEIGHADEKHFLALDASNSPEDA